MKNIVLIGPVAAGKTTVGRMLAEQRSEIFLDIDDLIEKEMALSILEIFQNYGEKYFRELETRVLERVIQQEKAIISTGGGIVLNPYHRDLIVSHSYVVYLQVDLNTQLERLANSTDRPLLAGQDRSKILQELHGIRHPLYEEIANISLDTSNKTVEHVVSALLPLRGSCHEVTEGG